MKNEADLLKRIVELEAQLEQSREEVVEHKSKDERSLNKYHKLKEKLVSEDKAWKEKWWKAEMDRRNIAIDLKLSTTKLKESDAEVNRLNCLVGERDATIKGLMVKMGALEKMNSEVELNHRESRLADNRRVEEKITDLFFKNEALTEEKVEREAELESLSAENRKLEEMIEVLEKGKVERESEMRNLESRLTYNRKSEEEIGELHLKIEVLERGWTERDSKIRDGDERIAGLRGALEEEKKRKGEARERIKSLECKKRALEEEIQKANSELERVKTEMEAEYKRKVLELSSRFEDYVSEIEAKDAIQDREFMEKMELMEKEKVDLIAMDWEQIEDIIGLNHKL